MGLIFYKLRKLFREKGGEISKVSLGLSFVCAGSFLIALPILLADDMSKKEKFQMCVTFLFTGIINILTLLYMDSFQINIILKMFLSVILSFIIFLPFVFVAMVYIEYKSIVLTKAEERESKLLGILRRK